jgi:hypothetical protein
MNVYLRFSAYFISAEIGRVKNLAKIGLMSKELIRRLRKIELKNSTKIAIAKKTMKFLTFL